MGRPLFVLNEARNKTVLGFFRNLYPNCLLTTKVANYLPVSLKYNVFKPFNANLISTEEICGIYAVLKVKYEECTRTNTSDSF